MRYPVYDRPGANVEVRSRLLSRIFVAVTLTMSPSTASLAHFEGRVYTEEMAKPHRSPLLGYNHNVKYRGRIFHVQTEDSGPANPRLFTHLYYEGTIRSEEHTSELQSHSFISYAVF